MTFRLLGLDLSTSVGHALLERGKPPVFGTLRLPYAPEGEPARRFAALQAWLEDYFTFPGFDAIAWERPILPRKSGDLASTQDTLELLWGLAAIPWTFAGRHNLPHKHVNVKDVKITLTGRQDASKDEMVAAAMKVMHWKVANDHEADAGAVGVYAMNILNPRRATP